MLNGSQKIIIWLRKTILTVLKNSDNELDIKIARQPPNGRSGSSRSRWLHPFRRERDEPLLPLEGS